MKKLFVILITVMSLPTFAYEGVVDKLNEKNILCNLEETFREAAAVAVRAHPSNERVKKLLEKAQAESAKCFSSAVEIEGTSKTCDEAVTRISDAGIICTLEVKLKEDATIEAQETPTRSNEEDLQWSIKRVNKCFSIAREICD